MADRRQELPCPEQFTPLHRIYIGIIEVKPDDGYMSRPQFIGSKNCPVAIRKTPEIIDVFERSTLRCGNHRAFETGHPGKEQGHIIPVCMDYYLSLIHISEPTRQAEISYAV